MAFDNLSVEAQNLLLTNHFYILKWVVFLSFVVLSVYYIGFVWRDQKQTKYIGVAVLRFFLFSLSVAYLLSVPFQVLVLSPEVNFYTFYLLPLKIYGIIVAVGLLVAFVDIFRYGPLVLVRLCGLDVEDDNVNEIARQIVNNRHFIKFSKGGRRGRG